MKTKLLLLITVIFTITVKFSLAQKWDKDQPNKLFAVDKNGNFNNIKVGIGTNNPNYPLEIIGIAKADSLVINNGAHIFGKLHIGNNSLTIGGQPSGTSDEITTDGQFIDIIRTSGSGPNDLTVGIGLPIPNTNWKLDVSENINITVASNIMNKGYGMNGHTILQCPANDVYVGEGAGVATILGGSTGLNNVFVGYKSGNVNTGGAQNTFIGREAGFKNENGGQSTFVGDNAGYNFISQVQNSMNTFVGARSGYLTTTGLHNTLIGSGACQQNTTGQYNTAIGSQAGYTNTTGSNNIFIGRYADASAGTFTNATAIGYLAYVEAPYSMVLGSIQNKNGYTNQTVKVGIGTTTPGNRLEILESTQSNGSSGLRLKGFYQYTPTANSNGKVLTIDYNTGDVILVNGGGGSGNTTICSTIPDNFITKRVPGNNTICKSLIYDNDFRVGIGNDLANPPLSALNVNTNLIPGGISGEMFRTDGPADQTNYWRLWTGTGTGSSEKGTIYVPAGTSDLTIQATQSSGNMIFRTDGYGRMFINNQNAGTYRGFVGIGQNFTAPRSLLHINDGAGSTYLQVTNSFTQANATDGMRFGILTAGIGVINQQENHPIYIYTNSGAQNTVKMYIGHNITTNEARVGIGTGTTMPGNLLELNTIDPTPNTTIGGNSGLTFQDLKATSTTLPSNPGTGVLSVDLNGKVVYVPRGGDGNITACTGLSPANLNFLSKWTNTTNPELCNSIVYDNVTNVGIGNFTPANLPLAALHVNTNLIPGGQPGEAFRTTSNATGTNVNAWRLYTGAGIGSEKFSLYVPAGSNNVVLQASTQNATMQFNVAGASIIPGFTAQIPRMIITDGATLGNTGFIGMGNNFLNPQSQLHINDGIYPTYIQITNASTNASQYLPTTTDGLKIGIAQNGNVEVLQQEGDNINPSPIRFKFYDGTIIQERVTMLNNGHVGIGTITPNDMLEINSPDLSPTTTVGGNSGLLFQDLTATSTPLSTNPGLGVLSVDATGKVVYVPGGGNGNITACSGVNLNYLSKWTNITNPANPELCNSIVFDNGINVGIGTNNPNNTLEINSPLANYYTNNPNICGGISTGASGLRFTDLTSGSAPCQSNNLALSVDENGNVILVPNGGSSVGADDDWYDPLTGIAPIDINSNKFTYGNVSIGVPTSPYCKFNINNTTEEVCSNLFSDASSLPSWTIPIGVNCMVLNASGVNFGIKGVSNSNNINASNNGIYSEAHGTSYSNYGIVSSAEGASTINVGIQSTVSGGVTNFALLASAPSGSNDLAGLFSGNVRVNGDVYAFSFNPSDINLKENIVSINGSLGIISQLQPKTFNFKTSDYPQMRLPQGQQFGLIAQDIESILPDLVIQTKQPAVYDSLGNVTTPSFDYKCLNYNALIPILIQGEKELNFKNDSLTQTIDSLKTIISTYESRFTSIENMLSQCCNQQSRLMQTDVNATIQISTDPTMNKQTQLYQNRPNPFNVKTTFAYTLGEGGNVELIVEDSYGRLVTTLVSQNQSSGEYSIDWNAENITSGIYFYSLKVNGTVLVKKAIKF